MPKKLRVSTKTRKKSWFKVLSPPIFGKQVVGRTLAYEPSSVVGRCLEVNLSTLLDDFTKQGQDIRLRVKKVNDSSAETEIIGFKLSNALLSRYVRKKTSLVYSSDVVTLKDGKRVRIKSFLVTSFRTRKKQKNSLVKGLKEMIGEAGGSYNLDALVTAVAGEKLQKKIQTKLRKIYPIKHVVVQKIELLKK